MPMVGEVFLMTTEPQRRIFEPKGKFDRFTYAHIAFFGPRCAFYMFALGEPLAGAIVATWSFIGAFYTVEWALSSYRRSRAIF